MIPYLLEHQAHGKHLVFGPKHEFDEEYNRVYIYIYTGDWWYISKNKMRPDAGVRLVCHVRQVNPTASCRVPHTAHVPYIIQCVSNHGVRQVHQVLEKIFCSIM